MEQQQNYFVVVLAHSFHGRLRRIHVPHKVIYISLFLALIGGLSVLLFVSSYARMAWKVANYNALKREADAVRARYQNLQKIVNQTNQQLATLQLFANEVSIAYGLKRKLEGPSNLVAEGRLLPTFSESVRDYNFLRGVAGLSRNYMRRFHENVQPSIWPVGGRLMGAFGERIDPFSGEGAWHTGVDIAAPTGTAVRAAADGIVARAERAGGYGRLVVVDHGNGMQTYYAHLSRFSVIAGQEIRRGEPVGEVGSSGRVTAPHLHYEVRIGGNPVNPYRYLKFGVTQVAKRDFPF